MDIMQGCIQVCHGFGPQCVECFEEMFSELTMKSGVI